MNSRQRRFVELLATSSMTQLQAFEAAGFIGDDANGHRLARHSGVAALVASLEEEQAELLAPEREVIHHMMANHTSVDILDATSPELGRALPPQLWDDDFAVAVDQYSMPVEIKLVDRLQSADRLLR